MNNWTIFLIVALIIGIFIYDDQNPILGNEPIWSKFDLDDHNKDYVNLNTYQPKNYQSYSKENNFRPLVFVMPESQVSNTINNLQEYNTQLIFLIHLIEV